LINGELDMSHGLLSGRSAGCIPLIVVAETDFEAWLARQEDFLRRWLSAAGFKSKPGRFTLVPDADGALKGGGGLHRNPR
jgi:hypothetical protein